MVATRERTRQKRGTVVPTGGSGGGAGNGIDRLTKFDGYDGHRFTPSNPGQGGIFDDGLKEFEKVTGQTLDKPALITAEQAGAATAFSKQMEKTVENAAKFYDAAKDVATGQLEIKKSHVEMKKHVATTYFNQVFGDKNSDADYAMHQMGLEGKRAGKEWEVKETAKEVKAEIKQFQSGMSRGF